MKCIILVGGSGERLWPISRELYPKSLLKLNMNKSLIQNTYETACSFMTPKNIILVSNVRQTLDTKIQLSDIYKNPIILSEPIAKNTAPAVASALTYLEGADKFCDKKSEKDKDDIVIILPVDFRINDKEKLIVALNKAKTLAKSGKIVALGVKPDYPESGYGYILAGKQIKQGREIIKFIEKPDKEQAEVFSSDNNYFWNCGIYVAKISVLTEAFHKYAPQIISEMDIDMFEENNNIKYSYYENMESISIDYAIMEKADNMALVELEGEWYDYGSWQTVYNNSQKDSQNNVIIGNVVLDKVKNSFVYSTKELVTASEVTDTVIVETEDAVLVCDRNKTSGVAKIVKELKRINNSTANIHKTVYRPWGYYTNLNGGKGWLTKIITVLPGHKLSLQSHKYRSEHWVVLEGEAFVILEDESYTLQKRQSINIPIKAKHSLQNHTKDILKILEVQKGNYISEDDIVRYEDIYGRVKPLMI